MPSDEIVTGAELLWYEERIRHLEGALKAVPRILYGLSLDDPRQAALAQKAIDIARTALGEKGEPLSKSPSQGAARRFVNGEIDKAEFDRLYEAATATEAGIIPPAAAARAGEAAP